MASRGKVFVGVLLLAISIAGSVSSAVGPAAGQVGAGPTPSDDAKRVAPPDGTAATKPALADFEGRKLDLSRDWDGAKACAVVRQMRVLECFRTPKEMDTRVESLKADYYGSYWCASPLRLYEHGDYGGRQLSFYDRGYVQDLPDYGFNDQTSSFIVGACTSYLAEHTGLSGAWYPGPTGAYSAVPAMLPSWNDRLSSIYIT